MISYDEIQKRMKESKPFIEVPSKNYDFTSGDFDGLTQDQVSAAEKMLMMPDIFILKGYAGTGKTFLLNRFLRLCPTRNVTVTAPTHKAVGVAGGDCTIHSYLNLKIAYEEDKQVLKQIGWIADKILSGGVLIIDEASMVSKELLKYIEEAQDLCNLKVIFIGDPAQIPPVGEDISPVWQLNAQEAMLTDIVRQARDSNIISLATAIRTGTTSYAGVEDFVNNKDVFSGNMRQMRDFYMQTIEEGSVAQIISHRNKIVDSSNTWGRNIVQNNPEEAFRIGEEVYIRSVGDDQVHKLEDFVVIEDISKPFEYTYKKTDYPFDVVSIHVKSWRGEEELLIPNSDGDKKNFDKSVNAIAIRARNRQESWGKFWALKNAISEVKHRYSMTAHRSQGSTFENVIVNCNDIPDSRLMYTAVTRASKKLFLLKT